MENKKRSLKINSVECDMREISEEILKTYDNISINSVIVITSKESKELIAKYDVSINGVYIAEGNEDIEVVTKNGKFEIFPEQKPQLPTILMVNGKLHIYPGAEDSLSGYTSIIVNGKLVCPKSLAGKISIQVNGNTEYYPDNAIVLENTLILDKVFILRAKKAEYYVSNKVIIIDDSLDIAKFSEKGVHFITPNALISESLVESVIHLFDVDTKITLLPDGCAFINDDVIFNEKLFKRHGGKLYINGDLTFDADSKDLVKQLKYLNVRGTVKISRDLQEEFEEIDPIYEDILYIKGILINDKSTVKIDKIMLDRHPEGITVCDCAIVNISEDITSEMIEKTLEFKDCAVVRCSPEQRNAVEVISQDTSIETSSDEATLKLFSNTDTKRINSIKYKF